jgi:hypothetical protein
MYLLTAVAFDDAVARKWLRGNYVPPKKARAVMAAKQELARKRMRRAGVRHQGDVVTSGAWLYDHFSKSAHHRRGPITRSISLELRQFSYGPHPDAVRRGVETSNAGETIETALIVVADSLAQIVGRAGLADVLAEQALELDRVRAAYPLAEGDEQ